MFLVEPDKLDSNDTLLANLMKNDSKTNEKQTQFCSNSLTSRMRYGVNR